MKLFIVFADDSPVKFFTDKMEAHKWAESVYHPFEDLNRVSVVAYKPVNPE